MKKKVLFIILILFSAFVFAQEAEKKNLNVKIDQVCSEKYPNMTAFVTVRDNKGEIVAGLAPGLFKTRIDSEELIGKQNIYPFSIKPEPIDYSILISNNGIMEGEPLDFQKTAVIQFIDYMQKGETLSLYTIGDDAVPVFENLQKEEIDTSLINSINVSDVQPRIYDSLLNVVRKLETKNTRRKIIIVISDGRDQNSRFSKDQLDSVLNEKTIPVYSVGIKVISSAGLSALNEISELTSGAYIYSQKLSDISNNIKIIRDIVNKCYVIDYKIKNVKADNNYHMIEVSILERDAEGKGQRTFLAVKLPVPRWLQITIAVVVIIFIIAFIVLIIIGKIKKRRAMGITKRKCPVCGNRMKDSWDFCPFCRYLPDIKRKKNKKDDKKENKEKK
ncbi:VWA domain-containing protein [Treponema sp.]|uniref:VWA domain-containing protein n=1 Tax=Treponema sp. TaxID=166 RepID=UPI002580C1F4|nr:VWA domain-containing protein [Treponema sp.]